MAKYTIKINENTKQGKAIVAYLKAMGVIVSENQKTKGSK
jgi:hypothetical protein